MEQYKQRQVPRLLQPIKQTTSINIINEVVELDILGKRMTVPTADAFKNLQRKVVALEQRLNGVDNKANRAMRQSYDRE